jgi:hypothetical protein
MSCQKPLAPVAEKTSAGRAGRESHDDYHTTSSQNSLLRAFAEESDEVAELTKA